MNHEHKSNLEKALLSQTWNRQLAKAVVMALEKYLKKPKEKKAPSILQLAVEREKGNQPKFDSGTSESFEE